MKVMSIIAKARSPQRRALYILLPFLLAALVVGYLLVSYQLKINAEERGFMALKRDMLELQKEFNKIDEGWSYVEGCVPKDQLYQADIVSTCGVTLTLKSANSKSDQLLSLDDFSALVSRTNVFHMTEATNGRQGGGYSTEAFSYDEIKGAKCYLTQFAGTNMQDGQDRYISFYCTAPAHAFYFPRIK